MSRSLNRWSCTLALIVALGLVGCGGDDDSDPVQPGGQGNTVDFDQTTALAQSDAAAQEAVTLVESMLDLAGGVAKGADNNWDYGWNPETMRWEWNYNFSGEGNVYDYFYTVQYFDSDGEPQQPALGAVRVDHNMLGVAELHGESGGAVYDYDWSYNYNTSMSGIGSDTLNLMGNGGYDMDYRYVSPQGNFHYLYNVSWQILGNGINRPAAGGCPTGSVRYDFEPFYLIIVFDGSSTAVSTLYDGNGNVIPEGSDTHPLGCITR